MMYINYFGFSPETKTFVVRFTDYKKGEIVELINGYNYHDYKVGYYSDNWIDCNLKDTWIPVERMTDSFFDDKLFTIEE